MFKRIFAFLLSLICVFLLSSCGKSISASDFMTDFATVYPLEGTMYFSEAQNKDEGYISEELFRKIYRIDGEIPADYAIYLNSKPSQGAECGIFKLREGADIEPITEMCLERIRLVADREAEGIVLRSGRYVFYSTLEDSERAKELFHRLIK